MKTADKINILVLVLAIFMLTANCLAKKPIVNYCLEMSKEGSILKFESVIDSSDFAKMEKRNIWQCDPECETQKKYFVKVDGRDSMTCLPGEYIFRNHVFLFRDMTLNATGGWSWEGRHGKSGFAGCSDCSHETKSYLHSVEASTEIIIDFPEYNTKVTKDPFKLNEIKSSFGDAIPVSWKFKINCPPHNDTTITGSYFIRITGECK
jgi:hypothetical protein